jgi:hypothetical protein
MNSCTHCSCHLGWRIYIYTEPTSRPGRRKSLMVLLPAPAPSQKRVQMYMQKIAKAERGDTSGGSQRCQTNSWTRAPAWRGESAVDDNRRSVLKLMTTRPQPFFPCAVTDEPGTGGNNDPKRPKINKDAAARVVRAGTSNRTPKRKADKARGTSGAKAFRRLHSRLGLRRAPRCSALRPPSYLTRI